MSGKLKEVNDATFEQEVLNSHKPVLVDFWAEWCGPCRMLTPTVEAVAEKFKESAVVVKLNVDDNPAIAGTFGIKGIPTLIVFKGGKEVERVVGATGKDSISRMLEKHLVLAGV
jgi:thioredoxin 1